MYSACVRVCCIQVERQCKDASEEIRGIEQQLSQLYQEQGRKEMNHKVSSLCLSRYI